MIIGADGKAVSTGGLTTKEPIVDMRIVVFQKMMVHPQTKEMVMVPMQDIQYQRQGSTEWFSMDGVQVENHEPNLENGKGLSSV
jgi:hypothetical protein